MNEEINYMIKKKEELTNWAEEFLNVATKYLKDEDYI